MAVLLALLATGPAAAAGARTGAPDHRAKDEKALHLRTSDATKVKDAGPPSGEESTIEEQADPLFSWFEELGFPDVSGLPYVRVRTWHENVIRDGFLVEDDGDRFVVIHEVDPVAYRRVEDVPAEHVPRYEELDLAEEIHSLLERFDPPEANDWEPVPPAWTRASRQLHYFFLARGAHAHGHEAEAVDLLRLADAAAGATGGPDPASLTQKVRRELVHTLMWENVLACGRPGPGRPELRERFRLIAREFPESEHASRAEGLAAILDRMITEDEAHAEPARPLSEVSVEERIDELIYRLRDQNGEQWAQPGSCDIFVDPRREESPAHRLAALGRDAVPALLAILDDERLTRSVGFHRDFYFSHHVLRYSDAARQILARISGQTFRSREEAEAWWEEVRDLDEFEVLREALTRADPNRVDDMARRIIALDRGRGMAAVVQATREAESWVRSNLVSVLASIEGDETVSFLLEEMRSGPELASRAAAARGLADRGSDEWIQPLVGQLDAVAHERAPESGVPMVSHRERGVEVTIHLLARRAGSEGLEALARLYSVFHVGRRLEVLRKVADVEIEEPEMRRLVETILVDALEDKAEIPWTIGTRSEAGSVNSPRLGNVAAHRLVRRWDLEDEFPWEGTEAEQAAYRQRLREMAAERRGE